ncbi:MAG: family 78 glycoside hydrolase catalytic domain [Opitutales bacterium]
MAQAPYIWTDDTATGRNRHAMFRRTFTLDDPGVVEKADLHIFADSRYRLVINGKTLPHGPVRFYPEHPPYDSHDLRPHLRQGPNVIGVLVCSFGSCRNFQAEPGPGGLVAWGEVDCGSQKIDLKTGPEWKALEADAFDTGAPKMSFALNPAEILDARKLPEDWAGPDCDDSDWPAATLVADQSTWGELEPRPIKFLDETPLRPVRVTGVFAAATPQEEEIHSFRLLSKAGEGRCDGLAAVFTWIHSPREQEITYGAWWGRHWINGADLKGEAIEGMDYRLNRTTTLREGWNAFYLLQELQWDVWGFYLALPKDAGLTVNAEKNEQCEHGFLSAIWEDDQARAAEAMPCPLKVPEDLPEEFGPWTPQPRGDHAGLPFYDRAWLEHRKIAGAMGVADLDLKKLRAELEPHEKLVIGLDFEREVLGRPRLRFEAGAGEVVDISYSERLTDQGVPKVAYRYQVEMGERYISRGGRQEWHLFHPRGFRYLELIAHQPGTFVLQDLDVTQSIYPTPDQEGEFACSDPLLNKIWRAGVEALRVNKEDVYLDCPHRERGLYVGDSLVEFMADRAAFGDSDIFRRSLALYWHGQGPNGLVKPAAHHSHAHGSHPDYSALMPQLLWTWYEATGDLDLVRHYKDQMVKLVNGLLTLRDDSGVYSDCGMGSYIDIARTARTGPSCAMNCLVKEAFAAAGRLLPLLGEPEEGRRWEEEAGAVTQIIREQFFDADAGLFLDYPHESEHEFSFSVHGNTLTVLYGIAEDKRVKHIIDWLCGELLSNFHHHPPRNGEDLNVNAYFSYYTLGAVLKVDRLNDALEFIRQCWGSMIERGAWCTWEYFYDKGADSLCHAWAAAPTWYLTNRVLGVQFPEPGNPDKVRIAPKPGGLNWAEGIYPHPRGPLKVRWEREDLKLNITHEAPEGVEVEVGSI